MGLRKQAQTRGTQIPALDAFVGRHFLWLLQHPCRPGMSVALVLISHLVLYHTYFAFGLTM